MRAIWQLWLLPLRHAPLAAALLQSIWLAGAVALGSVPWTGEAAAWMAAMLIGAGIWLWSMLLGMDLRGVCQPDSLLLPGFRRRLAGIGLLHLLQWVLLPTALGLLLGVPHALLAGALLLLLGAFGLASGSERYLNLLVWALFVLAGWKPGLAVQVARALAASPWAVPLALLLAVLLLRLALRNLLHVEDREIDSSPLENTQLGRSRLRGADGAPARRGAVGKRILKVFDATAQYAMAQALARWRARPSAQRRMVLVRRLLLPHDNPQAIALRLVLVAVLVSFYVVVAMHRQHFNAAAVGAYAILLGLTRFPRLGQGMRRMRPNLADLYLTLAPATRADYQKTLTDALLVLVPITVLTTVAYTALGIVFTHAAAPWRMLLDALLVGTGASLVALAVHLIGPEGRLGRAVVDIAVTLGAMATYWGGYWLLGVLGYAIGGAALALVTLGFGIAVWLGAQREYQRRTPCFDAPLE
ncbi:hypothetical protein ASG87_16095 [Frateuria sp. Soil773]|uniref:hypothetical protein n=1 Tax=Frateuria sp. Soil773 TaxID=1736407 RepID=UPI0006F6467C|nr:hypothetical protein [Frateuria sp. Soil773]KRE96515.1 hypothetical protein ASG87_16095 [Frateuria sp. Soil773]